MSPCLYHESMLIPWVHVYTIRPCLYHTKNKLQRQKFAKIQKYKLEKYWDTINRNTKIQGTEYINTNYKKRRNSNTRNINTEIQITKGHTYKLKDNKNISYKKVHP